MNSHLLGLSKCEFIFRLFTLHIVLHDLFDILLIDLRKSISDHSTLHDLTDRVYKNMLIQFISDFCKNVLIDYGLNSYHMRILRNF